LRRSLDNRTMSQLGPKPKSMRIAVMSAIARTADIVRRDQRVRKVPVTDSIASLFDHLVGACERRGRHCEVERPALMTNSNLVDCTTGRSAGFAPLRMRPVRCRSDEMHPQMLVP
jgi:hypothetical protein